MNSSKTTKCVICFTPHIHIVGGHVHKNGEVIIASLCKDHHRTNMIEGCKGCYGEWKEEMGLEEDFIMFKT